MDPLLAVSIVWLLAFPIVASLVASGEPLESSAAIVVPAAAAGARHAAVEAVPVFAATTPAAGAVASTDAATMRGALLVTASELLGAPAGRALVGLGMRSTSLRHEQTPYGTHFPYPFHYPVVERLLDHHLRYPLDTRAVATADDLGALLIDAAAMPANAKGVSPFPQAGPVAFAVLSRARSGGACAPQLNLAFLLSTDYTARDNEVKLELEQAARTCPGDPTPLWLLGEFQSERASIAPFDPASGAPAAIGVEQPFATFARLRKQFPGSSAGWAGAGDAELRLAYQLEPHEPFTARMHFRRALAFLKAAERVDANPELAVGVARAYAGLQQFGPAIAAQRRAGGGAGARAPLQARLVEYLERARNYSAGAGLAQTLAASPRMPVGEGLLMAASSMNFDSTGETYREDAHGPLSIGAGRFTPAHISLDDFQGGAGGGGANDLSFIPTYREVTGITGYERWCPGWSMRRDQILAGHPGEALEGLPGSFKSILPERPYECAQSKLLAGVAALEAGDSGRAVKLAQAETNGDKREPLARLNDDRQDLWRFAGDLPRARAAALAWRGAAPEEALAYDRSGEIEFLDHRYATAEKLFGQAVRFARISAGLDSMPEAEGLLKQGLALARLGRRDEALRAFAEADAAAAHVQGLATHFSNIEILGDTSAAAFVSYNALAQTGYIDLTEHRFTLATEAYEAARDRAHGLYQAADLATETVSRYGVMYNNLALAQAQVGDIKDALSSARLAVMADPMDPLALATEGYALARLGRDHTARDSLMTSVRQLPSQFSAWNDLGVIEAHLGHRSGAIGAFRHAVGTNPDYGLGWFNLGTILEQEGLAHVLTSQGAFGRAMNADPSLRGRKHELSLDEDVYITNLDLSKPLPANWSFTTIEKRPPATKLGIVLLLIAALQIGRALAGGQSFASSSAQWLLEAAESLLRRLPGRDAFTSTAVATCACGAIFLIPLLRSGSSNLVEVVLLLLGVAAIMAAVSRGRVLAARRDGVTLEQPGWRPAVVFGLAAALFGAAWAPLPVARTDREAATVHWIGPSIGAGIAVCLLILGVSLGVPIARTLAGVALVMTASMLVPIKPLDGGVVAGGKAANATSLALVGGGLFLLLGLST